MQRPPSKLAAPLAYDESMESQDNGQEEWLSEEVLTDEDFNQSMDQDQSQHGNTSQGDSQASMVEEHDAETMDGIKFAGEDDDLTNMEENLHNLENDDTRTKLEKSEDSLNAELGMFLIRKSDGKVDVVQERHMSSEYDESAKKDNDHDHGNDTDELLRMLGDDDSKTKKLQTRRTLNEKKVARPIQEDSTDDDLEGDQVTSVKVSKNMSFIKTLPKKAVPEDVTDSDVAEKVTTVKVPSKNVNAKKYPTRTVAKDIADSEPTEKVTIMKITKNVTAKKYPTRFVSKDMSDSDATEKVTTVKVPSKKGTAKKYPTRALAKDMSDSDADAKVTPMKVAKTVTAKKYPTRFVAKDNMSDSDAAEKVTTVKVSKNVTAKKYPTRFVAKDMSDSDAAEKVTPAKVPSKKVTAKKYPTRTVAKDMSDSEPEAKVTTVKVSKNVSFKKYPPKAQPEDMSDSDASEGETKTMQSMFRLSSARKGNFASKSTAKSSITTNSKSVLRAPNKPAKTLLNTVNKPQTSTPLKQYSNKLKGVERRAVQSTAATKAVPAPSPIIKQQANNKQSKPVITPPEMDDDDGDEDFDMDEFADDFSEDEENSQRLKRPEMMDEEIPTDDETDPSDFSFYDELPTSESDEVEDWFALDIRAERAGDYIPLLGHKAYELLSEEKKRVDTKLTSLRASISSILDKSRDQTKQIEEARRSLASIDALLTHT